MSLSFKIIVIDRLSGITIILIWIKLECLPQNYSKKFKVSEADLNFLSKEKDIGEEWKIALFLVGILFQIYQL